MWAARTPAIWSSLFATMATAGIVLLTAPGSGPSSVRSRRWVGGLRSAARRGLDVLLAEIVEGISDQRPEVAALYDVGDQLIGESPLPPTGYEVVAMHRGNVLEAAGDGGQRREAQLRMVQALYRCR